jgi:hypothetical protein
MNSIEADIQFERGLIVAAPFGWLEREPRDVLEFGERQFRRRQRVGGLLSYYYRAAA